MSDTVHSEMAARAFRSVVCTTPVREDEENLHRAKALAKWFDCPFTRRSKRSLARIFREESVTAIVVADAPIHIVLPTATESPLFFHPGMAWQRIAQMRKGQADRLIQAAYVRPGDTVVDATFGLGGDSLVFSEAVGPDGRVIGIESEWLLGRLFTYAQSHEMETYAAIRRNLLRIELLQGNHLDWLQQMPDNSADVVYFDPMFRRPLRNKYSNLETARSVTNPASVSERAWQEAIRVARRTVVLKERPGSGEFRRFQVEPDKPRTKFAFGVYWKGMPDDRD